MDRREFLSLVGIGATAAACSYCLSGCTVPDPGITGPSNVDFTLDLTNSANSGLLTAGGYVYNSGVIVAHTPNGYVAVSQTCTHQGATILYQLQSNNFYCPAHGSRFGVDGSVVNGPAQSRLVTYTVTLNGNSLHVHS